MSAYDGDGGETYNGDAENSSSENSNEGYDTECFTESSVESTESVSESTVTDNTEADDNSVFQDDNESKIETVESPVPESTDNNVESESTENDSHKNCPVNDGEWINADGSEGERGESKWVPDSDYVPQKSNPEGKTWGDIMEEHGIDGIEFNNGEPDFSEISKADIEIENFSTSRSDNFDQADAKLAEQWGCEPDEVAEWRSENHYTWHECGDMKTMQLVPSEVHNNITHRGGISNAKGV